MCMSVCVCGGGGGGKGVGKWKCCNVTYQNDHDDVECEAFVAEAAVKQHVQDGRSACVDLPER